MSRNPLIIVALGDSLTEGFGVGPGDAYPFVLQRLLQSEGIVCRLINAGVSGDTCRNLAARLEAVFRWAPDLVILEIGVNDLLMGRSVETIRRDLGAILEKLLAREIPVALAGMQAPPLGDPQTEAAFATLYSATAESFKIPLIRDFADPLWAAPGRVQYDGLHPNAEGYRAICTQILAEIMEIINRLA